MLRRRKGRRERMTGRIIPEAVLGAVPVPVFGNWRTRQLVDC
jgi:hypothetical protein